MTATIIPLKKRTQLNSIAFFMIYFAILSWDGEENKQKKYIKKMFTIFSIKFSANCEQEKLY